MRRSILLLLATLPLFTCSDEPELTPDAFREEYAVLYCKHLFSCCDSGERSFGSTGVCEEQTRNSLATLLGFAVAETPFARFLPELARSCLDRLRQPVCEDESLIAGCADSTVEPLHHAGEECSYSVECDSFYCVQPQKLARGACGTSGGPPCSGDDRACSADHYCDGSLCKPKKTTAQLCASGRECDSGVCDARLRSCQPRGTSFCDGK